MLLYVFYVLSRLRDFTTTTDELPKCWLSYVGNTVYSIPYSVFVADPWIYSIPYSVFVADPWIQ